MERERRPLTARTVQPHFKSGLTKRRWETRLADLSCILPDWWWSAQVSTFILDPPLPCITLVLLVLPVAPSPPPPITRGCGAVGLHSSAGMASAAVNALGQMGEAGSALMCLTMHFTAKLLKSCAVYTPAVDYLSSGQFNYPGPSVISAALLSLCSSQQA